MKDIPLFPLCNASSEVLGYLHNGDLLKVFPVIAPENIDLPYVVYQQISGYPENNLSDAPDVEFQTTQIDVYASTLSEAKAVATAIETTIENDAHVTAYNGVFVDEKTKDFHVSFDVDWIINR